jgi:FkbM family methyltransferase
MLSSIYTTWRDRGTATLLQAIGNQLVAGVHSKILRRRFLEKQIHDYRLLIDLQDRGISRGLLLFGTREVDHKILLEQIARPGMMVFDIGANIGYYALMELGLIGPTGRMLAIEPSPSNIALLKRNLELNSEGERITVLEGAVSDKPGTAAFHLSAHSNLGTFHASGSAEKLLSGEQISVRTYTVPELAAEHGAPDLIRMDVEGHEVEVIRGMIPAIREAAMKPTIIFETHLSRYSEDHDMAGVLRELFDCGYGVPRAASSWQEGTKRIEALGYKGSDPIPTDGVERVIFENISNEHALECICRTGGLRTVVLAPVD